eukprot:6479264-Amphidinium_carterae.2
MRRTHKNQEQVDINYLAFQTFSCQSKLVFHSIIVQQGMLWQLWQLLCSLLDGQACRAHSQPLSGWTRRSDSVWKLGISNTIQHYVHLEITSGFE